MIKSINKFTVTKRNFSRTVTFILRKEAGEEDVKKNSNGNGLIRVSHSGLGS
jgi:hypothetical protein